MRPWTLQCVLLGCLLLSGCSLFTKRQPPTSALPPTTSPVSQHERPDRDLLAVANGSGREPALPDPATMIPQRPTIHIPGIPDAPPKDDAVVVNPEHETGTIKQVAAVKATEAANNEGVLDALRRLRDTSRANFRKLAGFTAKLTRRETVQGQPRNEEVLQYKFRTAPMSMHLKWIGREAQGRELVYVANPHDDKVHILTARGDGALLMPAGKRFTFAPTANEIRSQARYDLREGGMGLSVTKFGALVDLVEKDPSQAKRLRYLGQQKRLERAALFEGVEETIPPRTEPLLPKGGRRLTYFDADPSSPSFGLPILVLAYGDDRREVEYYWFDQFQPTTFSDADFDPNRLWRK